MKLLTEISGGRIVGPSIVTTGITARDHDALYAHALVQAIKEYRAPWVLTQADAIMAYWQKGAK